jgi:hypothetical protein
MKIQRERFVIITSDNKKIFCGRAKSYEFRKITDLRNIAVTTYESEARARASFIRSWGYGEELLEDNEVKIVKVMETFSFIDF